MASFTTRVELHRAIDADYATLHTAMARQGFSRTIQSDAGQAYHLPTAEYDISANLAASDILARARLAASQTGKAASVLVTEATRRTWDNLPLVS